MMLEKKDAMRNHEYFREKLLNLKNDLSNRIEKVDSDIRHEDITTDLYDQAIELENEEVLNALADASGQELRLINLALSRIDSGTYFFCSECGDEIPQERLELLPYTQWCVNCAEKKQ